MEAELITADEAEKTVTDPFLVTLQVRAKHGDLYAAAKKLGSGKALADHLGVGVQDVYSWLSMTRVPPLWLKEEKHCGSHSKWTDPEWVREIEGKLLALTGKTLDQLFPEAIRSEDFLSVSKSTEITRIVDVEQLKLHQQELLALPSPEVEAERVEIKDMIAAALKMLTYREREIIKLRFGLGGGPPFTLEETGRVFKVTKERIRGIEKKALHKLREANRGLEHFGCRLQFRCLSCGHLWVTTDMEKTRLPCAICKQKTNGRQVDWDLAESDGPFLPETVQPEE